MSTEDEARKAYAEAGVELPELKEEPKEAPKEAPKEPEKAPEPAKAEEEPKEPLKDTEPKEQQPRKRGVYDDMKEERAKRQQAERERDEYRAKLEALNQAETPKDKQEAASDLDAFAKKIGADPEALREMQALFFKDQKPASDPEMARRLAAFEQWQKDNASVMEQQMFDREFNASLPKLQKLFPGASDEEMGSIRRELDKLSHTDEFHDKSLAYVAFENQDTLGALVSPKKRGMENKQRTGTDDVEAYEFDPNADLSKMSDSQRAKWQEGYEAAVKAEKANFSTDAQGRKVIL